MDEDLIIYSDGGARGNPGPASCAFIAEYKGKIVFKNSKYLGKSTNNFAEYSGVILAFEWLEKNISSYPSEGITFFLDSELVAKQLAGLFKVKNENLKQLFYKVKLLEKKLKTKVSYKNISREKNKLADFLVNKELDKHSLTLADSNKLS